MLNSSKIRKSNILFFINLKLVQIVEEILIENKNLPDMKIVNIIVENIHRLKITS